jgi:hypothetical protein
MRIESAEQKRSRIACAKRGIDDPAEVAAEPGVTQ